MDITRSIQRFLEENDTQAFTTTELASEVYEFDEEEVPQEYIPYVRTYLEALVRFSEIESGSTIEMRRDYDDPEPYFAAVQEE